MTKKELWETIQSQDPNLARVLEEVKKTFGKPETVEVKFKEVG